MLLNLISFGVGVSHPITCGNVLDSLDDYLNQRRIPLVYGNGKGNDCEIYLSVNCIYDRNINYNHLQLLADFKKKTVLQYIFIRVVVIEKIAVRSTIIMAKRKLKEREWLSLTSPSLDLSRKSMYLEAVKK